MPGRNGTGPLGAGPLTGGGFGWCAGASSIGYGRRLGFGQGLACRRGFGGFWGRGFVPMQVSPPNQKELLEEEKKFLQNRLQVIDEQLGNME